MFSMIKLAASRGFLPNCLEYFKAAFVAKSPCALSLLCSIIISLTVKLSPSFSNAFISFSFNNNSSSILYLKNISLYLFLSIYQSSLSRRTTAIAFIASPLPISSTPSLVPALTDICLMSTFKMSAIDCLILSI